MMKQQSYLFTATGQQLATVASLSRLGMIDRQERKRLNAHHAAIRAGFGVDGLATLGASDLGVARIEEGGLGFIANILPFESEGVRSSKPEKMVVLATIAQEGVGVVRIRVVRPDGSLHASFDVPSVDSLVRAALALDYDGGQVLNPRYI